MTPIRVASTALLLSLLVGCSDDDEEGVVDADGDGYAVDDCDDTNASLNPGMPELCNGINDDCDPTTTEAGKVALETGSGFVDVTADVMDGEYVATEEGTLWLCDGDYAAQISPRADLWIRGRSESPSAVTLTGNGGPGVYVTGDPVTVRISDVSLSEGQGLSDDSGATFGGGLMCDGGSAVTLERVHVTDNTATQGGGIFAAGCSLDVVDAEIEGNTAENGGGAVLIDGNHLFLNSRVAGNSASGSGGALYAAGNGGRVDLELDGTEIVGNEATSVGGVAVVGGDLVWSGSTGDSSGVSGTTGWGGLYLEDATAVLDVVDFGEPGTLDDNEWPDIFVAEKGARYMTGDDKSFECSASGCGSSNAYYTGASPGAGYDDDDVTQGNIVRSDSWATIDHVTVYGSADSSCKVTWQLLSTDDTPSSSTDWATEWSATSSWTSGDTYQRSPNIGMTVEPGRFYVVSYGMRCGACVFSRHFDMTASATDAGFGTVWGGLMSRDAWTGSGYVTPGVGPYPMAYYVTEL
jgi:predicted outer membrane repeat protein